MTKQQIMAYVASILHTMLEFENYTIPRSSVYMMLDSDIKKFEGIEYLLKTSGLITNTSETMTLTEKGILKAKECKEIHDSQLNKKTS